MNEISALLVYPSEFTVINKELRLNEMELNVLLHSKKVGSEGKYFLIDEIIFEDEDEKTSVAIILKNSEFNG